MIPDAAELIEQVLAAESDPACQRNAFIMLAQTEPHRAATYFDSILHRLDSLDPQLQLAIVEFILSFAADGEHRNKYSKVLLGLMASSYVSNMVRFEACTVLLALTVSPNAIKSIAQSYIDMAIKEADNNAKLIILERLNSLQAQHSAVVNEVILDVLRVLSTADSEIRSRAIRLVLNGLSSRVAEEMVSFFRKELAKLREVQDDKPTLEYKKELLRAVHVCASKFPENNEAALSTWIEFLADEESFQVPEVTIFIKESLESSSASVRNEIILSLAKSIHYVGKPQLAQSLLWILAEFSGTPACLQAVFEAVYDGLGELPMVDAEERSAMIALDSPTGATSKGPKILPDGTYATESAFSSSNAHLTHAKTNLKKMLLDGHHSVGASISLALTKLVLKLCPQDNKRRGEVLLISTSILRLGLSRFPAVPIDQDTYERVMLCIRVLANGGNTEFVQLLTKECKAAYESLQNQKESSNGLTMKNGSIGRSIQFRLVNKTKDEIKTIPADYAAKDLAKAVQETNNMASRSISALSKVVQLTGFSDPIYAETYVHVNQHDILLDVLVVNQTGETLQNVSFDMATGGELKVVDKPSPFNMAPHGFAAVKLSLKVSSTNNGLIYGSVSYGTVEPRSVVLASITIDIVDYIQPVFNVEEAEFRRSWVLLEWENKINIGPVQLSNNTSTALKTFLEDLLHACHLGCITPSFGLAEGGDYLAANMCAHSVFNEEVLANICLERTSGGSLESAQVAGHVRLRSKTQGIAIALGDKINSFVSRKK